MVKDVEKTEEKLPDNLDDLRSIAAAERGASGFEKLTVLADGSSSMDEAFKGVDSKSKWVALGEAVSMLWEKTDWAICDTTLHTFAGNTRQLEFGISGPPILRQPDHVHATQFDTALKIAFRDSPNRIILISDGEGGYPEGEIVVCNEKQITVDTIFIAGHYSSRGEETLRKISEATGGMFCTVENAEQLMEGLAQLETSERLLLTHESEDDGAIEL